MRYRRDVFDDKYARLRGDRPSKTIVSHLAKDGNGYIHPTQVRSISMREAARAPVVPRRVCVLRFSVRPVGPGRQCSSASARGGHRASFCRMLQKGRQGMTQGLQTGSVEFRPRARLLKLIGAELISDEVLAITELVKNAHDADASAVTSSSRGSRARGQASSSATTATAWTSTFFWVAGWSRREPRSRALTRRITRRGRRVLGEKGVGRFAADKLARTLELVSRRDGDATGDPRGVRLGRVRYGRAHALGGQEPVGGQAASEVITHGTVLRMTGLRTAWNERMFRRLCTRLARLRSPFNGARQLRHPDRVRRVPAVLGRAQVRHSRAGAVPDRRGVRREADRRDQPEWLALRRAPLERARGSELRPGAGPTLRLRSGNRGGRAHRSTDGSARLAEGMVRHQHLPRRIPGLAIRRTARRLAAARSASGQQSRCPAEQQPGRRLRRDHAETGTPSSPIRPTARDFSSRGRSMTCVG